MKKLLLSLLGLGIFFVSYTQRSIVGTVHDENNLPVVGVNIVVKGTLIGTITDSEGAYSITTASPDNGILVFSFVGYQTQEIEILDRTIIDVSLKPDLVQIEQLVVVGYGTQEKREITGSVATVDVDQLNKSNSLTLTDKLQGLVPGVSVNTTGQPGSIGDIMIRGASFFGGNNPLYVIDGILTGDSPNLNPNDIESVQILKDASASAIYGNRAANGVIIITTKKGTKGKLRINFTSNTALQEITSRIPLTDNYGWARIINAAHDAIGAPRQSLADVDFNPDLNTDWQDEVYSENALMSDVNLSVSGGGESHSVYFSINHHYQDGTIEGPNFKRISTRLNSEFTFWKKLTVGQHLTVGYAKTTGLAGSESVEEYTGDIIGPFSAAYEMLPVIPVYDSSQISGYGIGEFNKAQTWSENPIGVMNMFHNFTENVTILGDIFLNYEILEGLDYRLSIGLKSSFNNFKRYNKAGRLRMSTDHFSGLAQQEVREYGLFLENRLSYSKTISKHSFSLMATHTEQSDRGYNIGAVSVGGYDDEVNFWQLSNSTGKVSAGGTEYQSAIISFLGRMTYNYDKRYFLTAIIRADGSSKFSPENRWGTFPSVSGGWDISKENFFDVGFIRHLKFRVGYGKVGNASIDDYQYSTIIDRRARGSNYWDAGVNYNLGPTSVSVIGATRSEQLNNRNISWEKLSETNIGLDIEAFNGQLAFNGDYYFGTMNDLLAEMPIPSTIGTRWPAFAVINAVSMTRQGWEAAMSYRKLSGDFRYSITANFSHSTNEITDLGFGLSDISTDGRTIATIGNQLGKFYLLEYLGIYTQEEIDVLPEGFEVAGDPPEVGDAKYRDTNGRDSEGKLTGKPDGKISLDDDRIITGNPIPMLEFGLNLNLDYKIFDLTVFVHGVSGRDVYNTYNAEMTSGEWGHFSNYPAYFDPYIDGAGVDPRPIWDNGHGNNLPSTRFLENGAYVRLKNIQLGVTLPENRIGNFRFFLSGQNLLTLTKYKGLDPEFIGGDVFTPGIDPRGYPVVRSLSIGLDLTFRPGS
jgi:TonB-linked SusC/RagA family outer membrane protein